MPDEQLNGPRPEEQAAGWERGLSRNRARVPVLVAEEVGRVVGFAVVGPAQDPEGVTTASYPSKAAAKLRTTGTASSR